MDGHEWTYLVRGNRTPLRPGMCFSDEPGIYVPGELGVRHEDIIVITESGAENLTKWSGTPEDPAVDLTERAPPAPGARIPRPSPDGAGIGSREVAEDDHADPLGGEAADPRLEPLPRPAVLEQRMALVTGDEPTEPVPAAARVGGVSRSTSRAGVHICSRSAARSGAVGVEGERPSAPCRATLR